jgi:hypothetical protein
VLEIYHHPQSRQYPKYGILTLSEVAGLEGSYPFIPFLLGYSLKPINRL